MKGDLNESTLEDLYCLMMRETMKKPKSIIYRSARTGRAVTKAYAKAHPATTEREVYKRRRIKRRKRRL